MTEQVKTEEQLKTEGVYLLLQVRLVAAQTLLRSLREEHKAGCKQIGLGLGGNVDLEGIASRIRDTEKRILAMQPLLKYASARLAACEDVQIEAAETQVNEIAAAPNPSGVTVVAARDYCQTEQAELRSYAGVS